MYWVVALVTCAYCFCYMCGLLLCVVLLCFILTLVFCVVSGFSVGHGNEVTGAFGIVKVFCYLPQVNQVTGFYLCTISSCHAHVFSYVSPSLCFLFIKTCILLFQFMFKFLLCFPGDVEYTYHDQVPIVFNYNYNLFR